ncbi:MAG: hypothetical protein LBB79_06260, partial [Prevotellaceae bacterium]|nr:hypothetical protein [Prevotellaceae bacterium]
GVMGKNEVALATQSPAETTLWERQQVSSLRDLRGERYRYRRLKPTVNQVSSLRDLRGERYR